MLDGWSGADDESYILLEDTVGPSLTMNARLTWRCKRPRPRPPWQAENADQHNCQLIYGDAKMREIFGRIAPGQPRSLLFRERLQALDIRGHVSSAPSNFSRNASPGSSNAHRGCNVKRTRSPAGCHPSSSAFATAIGATMEFCIPVPADAASRPYPQAARRRDGRIRHGHDLCPRSPWTTSRSDGRARVAPEGECHHAVLGLHVDEPPSGEVIVGGDERDIPAQTLQDEREVVRHWKGKNPATT